MSPIRLVAAFVLSAAAAFVFVALVVLLARGPHVVDPPEVVEVPLEVSTSSTVDRLLATIVDVCAADDDPGICATLLLSRAGFLPEVAGPTDE